jgi:hypothetical protein
VRIEPTGLEAGEVEDVVDDAHQHVAAAVQGAQIALLLGRERRLTEQRRHADQAVQRRADLMAHRRQELAAQARRLHRVVARVPHARDGAAQANLGHRQRGEILERGHRRGRPLARRVVDDAQRSECGALFGDERDAGIGDDAEIRHAEVLGDDLVLPGIIDDEGPAARHRELAEGMRERRLAPRSPRLGQTDRALEELPIRVDERDQRHRRVAQARRQPGQTIERRFVRGIEQPRRVERLEAGGVVEDGVDHQV